MGKESLIKSTTKKKGPAKKTAVKKAPAKQKTTAAKSSASPKKKAPKKTAQRSAPVKAKKTAPAKAKAAPKKKASVKAAVTRKPSRAELLARGFDRPAPVAVYAPPAARPIVGDAPPIAHSARVKALLLKPLALSARPADSAAPPKPKAAPKAPSKPASAPAPASRPAPTPQPPSPLPDSGARKMMTRLTITVAVAFLLIIAASKTNSHKYYLEAKDGALVIWKGNFAPKGRHLLMTLPGVAMPAETRAIYPQSDVYPMIYNYFIGRADTLLATPGRIDLDGIKEYLTKAKAYALTPAMAEDLYRRTNGIDLMILLYKAEVAASRNTPESLAEALAHLDAARRLDPDPAHKELIAKKAEEFQVQQAALDAQSEEAEATK